MGELKSGFGVFPEPIDVGPGAREGGGEVEVLVFEDEEGVGVSGVRGGVEEDVMSGFAGDGEAEGGGVDERESEVGVWVGEEDFAAVGSGR